MEIINFFRNAYSAFEEDNKVDRARLIHFLLRCSETEVKIFFTEEQKQKLFCLGPKSDSKVSYSLKILYEVILQEFFLNALFSQQDAEEYGSVDFIDHFSYVLLAIYQLACYQHMTANNQISKNKAEDFSSKHLYAWDDKRGVIRQLIKAQLKKLAAKKQLLHVTEEIYIERCVYEIMAGGKTVDQLLQEITLKRYTFVSEMFKLIPSVLPDLKLNLEAIRAYTVNNTSQKIAIKTRLLNYYTNNPKTWGSIFRDTYAQLGVKSYAGIASSYAAAYYCFAPMGLVAANVAVFGYLAYQYNQRSPFNQRTILKLIENVLKDWRHLVSYYNSPEEAHFIKLNIQEHCSRLKQGICPPDKTIYELIKYRALELAALLKPIQPKIDWKQINGFLKQQQSVIHSGKLSTESIIPEVLFLPKHTQDNTGNASTSRLQSTKKAKTCDTKQQFQNNVKGNTVQETVSDIRYVTMTNHATVAFQIASDAEKHIPDELNQCAIKFHQQPLEQLFLEGEFDRILRPQAQFGGFKKMSYNGDAYELKPFHGADSRLVFRVAGKIKLPTLPGSQHLFAQTCPLYIYNGENLRHK